MEPSFREWKAAALERLRELREEYPEHARVINFLISELEGLRPDPNMLLIFAKHVREAKKRVPELEEVAPSPKMISELFMSKLIW